MRIQKFIFGDFILLNIRRKNEKKKNNNNNNNKNNVKSKSPLVSGREGDESLIHKPSTFSI